MIAITSHRPHAKSAEYARNQKLAWRTWQGFFTDIIYFGDEEPELKSFKTRFVRSEQWPTIKIMAQLAATARGIACIINADILINPKLRVVENRLANGPAAVASSRRWHIDPHLPNFDRAQLVDTDRGRDIFVCTRVVWQRIAAEIPGHLRIGHQQWDAWMTDFFNAHYHDRFIDFTQMKCIFHPKHEDRQMPFAEDIVKATG